MAKAIAHCTCEVCGSEFEKVKRDCYNRTQADNWEEWASEHYTICPDCWREKQKHAQLKYAIVVDDNKVYSNGIRISLIVTSSNSYDRKEELKQYGFRWVNNSWRISSYISRYDEIESCVKNLISETEEKCGEMKQSSIHSYEQIKYHADSGIEIHRITARWIKFACEVYAEYKDRLEYPVYPEEFTSIVNGRKWNCKFYGKNKDTIYLDGEKIVLDSDLVGKIKEVENRRDEYKKVADEVSDVIQERLAEYSRERREKARKARLEARKDGEQQ